MEMLHFLLIFFPVNAVLIYFNNFVLVPRLLFPKKYLLYSLVISVLIVGFAYLEFHILPIKQGQGTDDFLFIIPNLMGFVMIATGLKYTRWSIQQSRAIEQLERKQQLTELARLKAQVNPHFLFNTLNHTYALSIKEDAHDTGESILRLSSLMKYMLVASKQQFVPLESEINYIRQYLDLEQSRLRERLCLELDIKGDFSDVFLPPFLFIPFVENIFKHGYFPAKPRQAVIIKIHRTETGVEFHAQNPKRQEAQQKESTNIGIKNVQERLRIDFPKQHHLHIEAREATYIVDLRLDL